MCGVPVQHDVLGPHTALLQVATHRAHELPRCEAGCGLASSCEEWANGWLLTAVQRGKGVDEDWDLAQLQEDAALEVSLICLICVGCTIMLAATAQQAETAPLWPPVRVCKQFTARATVGYALQASQHAGRS